MSVDLMAIMAIIAGLVFFIIAIAVVRGRELKHLPYESRGPLLTPAELNFHHALKLAIPDGYVLTFKVRIGDVLKVRRGLNKKSALIMRAKIQQKHFDFVVCRQNMSVACCIELNDASHRRRDRMKRDLFVRSACNAAGVPLIEYPAKKSYQVSDVRRTVKSVL